MDGTVFLFQHFNNLCVGGDEDYLDQAIELFHAAMDNLVHRTVPITETLDDTLLSELKSSWPLVCATFGDSLKDVFIAVFTSMYFNNAILASIVYFIKFLHLLLYQKCTKGS